MEHAIVRPIGLNKEKEEISKASKRCLRTRHCPAKVLKLNSGIEPEVYKPPTKMTRSRSGTGSSVQTSVCVDLDLTMDQESTSKLSQTGNRSRSRSIIRSKSNASNGSKENMKIESSLSDSEDEKEDSFHYLQMREKNLKANAEFFATLGIDKAKEMFHSLSSKKVKVPTQRGLKLKKEPSDNSPLPLRKSMRVRGVDPQGNNVHKPVVHEDLRPVELRLPTGPAAMLDYLYSSKADMMSDGNYRLKTLSSQMCHLEKKGKSNVSADTDIISLASHLDKVCITEERVAKVVPGRVFSLSWHPSSLIAVAGDKYGHIGFWDVATSSDAIVTAFKPHIKPVSHLFIPKSSPNKVFSCSYDATLRCGDFERNVFDEIFSVEEDLDDIFRNFDFIDGTNTMLVSQYSGVVSLVDIRTQGTSAEEVYQVSKKSLRTVSVHPHERHYFITAGVDANINMWDLRFMGRKCPKPLQTVTQHTKAVSSAYFSPNGNKVISSSSDDTILVFSMKDKTLELSKRIRHNNCTGRWLTKFQPTWHPFVDDVFVTGSMGRPREIQIYETNGSVLKSLKNDDYLGSVCSLNVFHPQSLCSLVGANSSGRLHVFM